MVKGIPYQFIFNKDAIFNSTIKWFKGRFVEIECLLNLEEYGTRPCTLILPYTKLRTYLWSMKVKVKRPLFHNKCSFTFTKLDNGNMKIDNIKVID